MFNLTFLDIKNNKKIYKKVKKLYNDAFPQNERVPISFLKLLARKDKAKFYGISDNEKFVGLVYNVYYKDIVFVFYLAIDKEQRGQGYGSKVLQVIQEKYCNHRIILNIEQIDKNSDNYEERLKRKTFYQRNGFYELNYTIREAKVVYEMLCSNKDNRRVEPDEYKELMRYYWGDLLYKYGYKKISE